MDLPIEIKMSLQEFRKELAKRELVGYERGYSEGYSNAKQIYGDEQI